MKYDIDQATQAYKQLKSRFDHLRATAKCYEPDLIGVFQALRNHLTSTRWLLDKLRIADIEGRQIEPDLFDELQENIRLLRQKLRLVEKFKVSSV